MWGGECVGVGGRGGESTSDAMMWSELWWCSCPWQVMAALDGRSTAAPTLAHDHQPPPPNPAGRLLEQCGGGDRGGSGRRLRGHSVKISGLHEDADNSALFAMLHSIGVPASDVDVPFDPDTGVCARARQSRTHDACGGPYYEHAPWQRRFRALVSALNMAGCRLTGESFGYGVATFPDRLAALRVIDTLNAASPAVVAPRGGCLHVQMMP